MASLQSVRELSEKIGKKLSDDQIESIARQCGEFDVEKTAVALRMFETGEVTATKILSAIRKNPIQAERVTCGFCNNHHIYILDARIYNSIQPDYEQPIQMHRAVCHCPNCHPSCKDSAQKAIDRMNPTEKAWTYVILYDQIRYHHYANERHPRLIPPDQFNLNEYFPDLDLNPELTSQQIDVMWKSHEPTKNTHITLTRPQTSTGTHQTMYDNLMGQLLHKTEVR